MNISGAFFLERHQIQTQIENNKMIARSQNSLGCDEQTNWAFAITIQVSFAKKYWGIPKLLVLKPFYFLGKPSKCHKMAQMHQGIRYKNIKLFGVINWSAAGCSFIVNRRQKIMQQQGGKVFIKTLLSLLQKLKTK